MRKMIENVAARSRTGLQQSLLSRQIGVPLTALFERSDDDMEPVEKDVYV